MTENRLRLPGDGKRRNCLLYTSDAADDMQCVDLGGRRIIKKKFFQAEDGIRDFCLSRGLGDVYKRQMSKDSACQPENVCSLPQERQNNNRRKDSLE